MPRYFFHVYDDALTFDDIGLSMPDLACAKVHATRAAVAAFKERMEMGDEREGWLMEVADDQNLMLLRFTLSAMTGDRSSPMHLTVTPGRGRMH